MRRILSYTLTLLLLASCGNNEEMLRERAAELCRYIPDHVLREESRPYMTEDFYAVLDTMFNRLPELEAMDHEWLHYFVTGNAGTIPVYEVVSVEQTDRTHAQATIRVQQAWEDGSIAQEDEAEEHLLCMEKVGGQWLMSDFDGHKADCIRHIALNRDEQAVRNAVSDYLVKEIGSGYLQGELCIPSLMMVAEDERESLPANVWGDFWIFWYNISGDTLVTVSGGNHSGRMTLNKKDGSYVVTEFEQTTDGAGYEASAKRIFGQHYDLYQYMHSNQDVSEAVRQEQLRQYISSKGLNVGYYKDFGWPAVKL